MFFKYLLIVCLSAIATADVGTGLYGYVPFCQDTHGTVVLTESAINKNMFIILQVHLPATARQIAYLHRKRHSVSRAASGIGTDTEVDFKKRKTVVFMDGYMDSLHLQTARVLMGNWAYMGYNVIAVDAQPLYSQAYPLAIRAGYQVGNVTAKLIKDLMQYGLRPQDVTLLGISLGGQIVSMVAKHFIKQTGNKIGRIFSMDPSGPCYRGMSPENRLTPSDADFVQVVHSGNDGFGMGDAVGHVDFYINGGEWQQVFNTDQPWCEDFCSHFSISVYFYSSLRLFQDKFVGVKCKNVQQARDHKCYDNYPHETNVMGFKADIKKPGIYYVPAKGEAPLHAPDDWLEKKIVYPLIYNDALSGVDHFVLSQRSLDFNLSPPEIINKNYFGRNET